MTSSPPSNAGPVLTGLARAAIAETLQTGQFAGTGWPQSGPDSPGVGPDSPGVGPSARAVAPRGVAAPAAAGERAADGATRTAPAAGSEAFLDRPGAAFVTLTQGGELRGCIGSLEAWRPLRQDVRANARAAAFDDPRFAPLGVGELDRTRIEVSVLSAPKPVVFADRDDLLAQLRPGVDGLILTAPGGRGTFLPQVWEQLETPELFLAHLVRKAGLPSGYWSDRVRVERYSVTAFEEPPR